MAQEASNPALAPSELFGLDQRRFSDSKMAVDNVSTSKTLTNELSKTSDDAGTVQQHAIQDISYLGLDEAPVKKTFSLLGILALGFTVCNSWLGVAASFAIAVNAGGSVSIIYGIIVVGFMTLCVGLSLAELASIYPTAGGQYHFVSILSPKEYSKAFSYICGFTGMASWIAISSSVTIATANVLMTFPLLFDPSYVPKQWHYFLVYQAVNIQSALYNLFATRTSSMLFEFGCMRTPHPHVPPNLPL